MTQKYCKPYRLNIDVRTCLSRLEIINKEFERYGLKSLNKDQKKCLECQGVTEVSSKVEEPICIICEKKASEVARFHPLLKKCSCCYQKDYRKESNSAGAALEVRI